MSEPMSWLLQQYNLIWRGACDSFRRRIGKRGVKPPRSRRCERRVSPRYATGLFKLGKAGRGRDAQVRRTARHRKFV